MTDMTAAEKNAALGELYFLRALNHFNLLNYFGAIPVKITPTVGVSGINVPRNEVDAVYAQIIQDLAFAAENLPSGSSKIKASANAAKALLARVYLYKKDYSNAARYANEVINSGKYELLADYAAIFASEETAESIFEVDFTPLDKNRIAEYNFPLTLNGRREVAPSDDLIASYGAGDTRLAASIATAGGLQYAIKYNDLSTGSDNVIVLRLSDMYLIRAEANAQLAGDVDAIKSDLNTVRSRAGLAATTAATYADLLTAIEAERRVEFAFEGQRWFDLVRTGRAIDVLPTVTSINQTLFPIPLSEMLTNTNTGMYQNPGY
jgi:tetratricopeptide (TPR) repeat protein